jgi:hypothetical protein
MTRAHLRVSVVVTALIAAAIAYAAARDRTPEALPLRPPGQRPVLLLLTSLPLMFGDEFSLDPGGSPALEALRTRYQLQPISVTDDQELKTGRLLLMAHPLAQPAEDLVALDRWVRGGGRVLLLADPMLEWPSERPLGDPLRPPPMFMDTGLLAHWGLRLDPPDERGPELRQLAGYRVSTASPGSLSGRCAISKDRLVARCSVGKGKATIVADADLLDVQHLAGPTQHNLDSVLAALAELERL